VQQPQLIDQAGGEGLVDGGRAALDRDIAVAGRRACLCQWLPTATATSSPAS